MIVIFRETNDEGDQQTLFTVTLTNGVLLVSGDVAVAEMLEIPDRPLVLIGGEVIDPKEEPDLYLEQLAVAYSGSRLRAEFVA